jgi:hypothetical protein
MRRMGPAASLIAALMVLLWVLFLMDLRTALGQTLEPPVLKPLRVNRDLLVLYDFKLAEGTVIPDMSGVLPRLDLEIPDQSKVEWLKPGLRVKEATILKTKGARDKLDTTLTFGQGITIEAWIKPLNNTQGGPARIVTFSKDSGYRNFTLGQDGNYYQQRFRTSATNSNGSDLSIVTVAGTIEDPPKLQHVVYTRASEGSARIFLDGVQVASGNIPGDGAVWDFTYDFGLVNETNYPIDDRTWLGDLFLVAIYGDNLTGAEVKQNFDAGVPLMAASTYSITLAWDPNTETDLKGYRIYESRKTNEYKGWVAEILCRANETTCCQYTRVVPTSGKYYWVATAIDDENNESDYSMELEHTFAPSAPTNAEVTEK